MVCCCVDEKEFCSAYVAWDTSCARRVYNVILYILEISFVDADLTNYNG